MRKKFYYVLPNTECCKVLVNSLKKTGLGDKDIRLVTRENTELTNLPKVIDLRETELTYGLWLGLSIGCIAGFLGGILAMMFPPNGVMLTMYVALLLVTTVTGTFFGGFVSAIIAMDIPNHTLEKIQYAIAEGKVLLMLNIPLCRFDNRIAKIMNYHPEAKPVTI